MGNTIWENENSTFQKIMNIVKDKGEKKEFSTGHMLRAGRLTDNERTSQKADIYDFKNDNNENIIFQENDKIVEITYIYDKETLDQVSITYDKTTSQFAYYLHSGNMGHNLLALVSPNDSKFPIYGTNIVRDEDSLNTLKKIGEMPDIEKGSSIRENIEKTLRSNPVLEERAQDVLKAFDQILSIDREREIKPLSPIEIENAKLKADNEKLSNDNEKLGENIICQSNRIKTLMAENSGSKEKISSLESQIKELKRQLTVSENKNRGLSDIIAKVKEVVSKIPFFGKKALKNIGIEEMQLSQSTIAEGKEETTTSDREKMLEGIIYRAVAVKGQERKTKDGIDLVEEKTGDERVD